MKTYDDSQGRANNIQDYISNDDLLSDDDDHKQPEPNDFSDDENIIVPDMYVAAGEEINIIANENVNDNNVNNIQHEVRIVFFFVYTYIFR